ncbi:nitrate reductase cytochrome c-type subunit [Sansalvadorimonas sp. 2012CJ34-2]|uniref:Periplasmic nitrate reductase, electron transfer subunit n=1 Tax=Parendozoicomonas callyspongiae TaxID=2942213 RepID=A0ABT0PEE6_9GAMM|nr:nitrate reductase cytochrome c-type subunit [Sansalvadorimonas sp. 2012CJ34-2]MCL6268918.1 nitrate reductase cytochrome c-type subunit [Sansalvadorimonas sp. 2012CJ34-2]
MSTHLHLKSPSKFLKSFLTVIAVCLSFGAFADGTSLRGGVLNEEAPAPALKKILETDGNLDRQFVDQPPLIPHDIRGYQVDKNVNKCLSCHSWKNAKKWNAPRISVTHFKNRDGKVLADVAPGRYFCLQCHVPQVDAKPLIENKFKPVESLD